MVLLCVCMSVACIEKWEGPPQELTVSGAPVCMSVACFKKWERPPLDPGAHSEWCSCVLA